MNKTKGLILIVEDDASICAYMEEIFGGDGFQVVSAEHGQAALDLLHSMQTLPALIFLDLMMPVMDGQRFLQEIQKNPAHERFKTLPVVVVTASHMPVKGEVVAVIRKPPDLNRLVELAEKYAGG